MLERTYYILRNPNTGQVICAHDRSGRITDKPALYQSTGRAKQGRSNRHTDCPNPAEWEVVPVQLKVTYDGHTS